jgi:hypothetical protein
MSEIASSGIGLFRHEVPLKKCSDQNASVSITLNMNPIEITSNSSRRSSRASSFAQVDESPNRNSTGFVGRERSVSIASSKGSSKQTPIKAESRQETEHEMSFTNYSEREQEIEDSLYDEEEIFSEKGEDKSLFFTAGAVESMTQAMPIAISSSSENESSDSDSVISGKTRRNKASKLTLSSAKVELSISPGYKIKENEFTTPVKASFDLLQKSNSLIIEKKHDTYIIPTVTSQGEDLQKPNTPAISTIPSLTTPTISIIPTIPTNPTTPSLNNPIFPKIPNNPEHVYSTPNGLDKLESRQHKSSLSEKTDCRVHTPSLTDKNIATQEDPIPFKDIPKPTVSTSPQPAIPMEFGRDHSPTFSEKSDPKKLSDLYDTKGSHIVDVDYDGSGSEIGFHLRNLQSGNSLSASTCFKTGGISSPSDIDDKFEEIPSPFKQLEDIDNVVKLDYDELRKSISMKKSSDSSSSEEEPLKYEETPMGLPFTSMNDVKPNAFSKDEVIEQNEFKSGIGGGKRTSACTGCTIF